MKNRQYIMITSAYNEAKIIGRTIQSVIKQSILPIQWIIVDDGSNDDTSHLANKYAEKYPFISVFTKTHDQVEFGEHMAINIKYGLTKIKDNNWDYLALLDADIEIDREDFYEYQLNKFESIPELGISSGVTYFFQGHQKRKNEKRPYWRTGGATKLYRRKCFEEIGGIEPIFAWDGLDVYKAMYKKWKTRTYFELEVYHMGAERMKKRHLSLVKATLIGKSFYQRGYPLEFVYLKVIKFFLTGNHKYAKELFRSYRNSKKKCIIQFVDKNEKKFIRRVLYLRMIDKFVPTKLL